MGPGRARLHGPARPPGGQQDRARGSRGQGAITTCDPRGLASASRPCARADTARLPLSAGPEQRCFLFVAPPGSWGVCSAPVPRAQRSLLLEQRARLGSAPETAAGPPGPLPRCRLPDRPHSPPPARFLSVALVALEDAVNGTYEVHRASSLRGASAVRARPPPLCSQVSPQGLEML